MTRVAIAIGSNLGDRRARIASAVDRLAVFLANPILSSLIETEPVGVSGDQPPFLNGAIVADFEGSPRQLLDAILAVEAACGRERPYPGAPRTLDLDLILFGSLVIDEPGLQVPHPRFRDRAFVLAPLAEIAPEAVDPVTGLTVAELYERWKERHACASH